MDLITSLSIELEYFIYLVMVTCHLKRATINEAYTKKTKRKRVANATPTNYIEPLKWTTFVAHFFKCLNLLFLSTLYTDCLHIQNIYI